MVQVDKMLNPGKENQIQQVCRGWYYQDQLPELAPDTAPSGVRKSHPFVEGAPGSPTPPTPVDNLWAPHSPH